MRISRGRASGATAVARAAFLATLAVVGCRGGTPGIENPTPGPAPRAYAADEVFFVEVWGAQAPDTAVSFPAAHARSIVLRHGPPDNTIFAAIDIPANALSPRGGGDSVTLAIRPLPGIYGLTLTSESAVSEPMILTFKYPVHFAAPSDSRARYPSDVLFEQALVVAIAEDGGTRYQTLRSTRPASDNLQATISALGQYQIVAPR
ncbi:MAG TPA: hypothetical protein VFV65_00735 [Gemmatimonadales bacterium]|nr:hypothetical protein [Gemmatimonadales bacterium]